MQTQGGGRAAGPGPPRYGPPPGYGYWPVLQRPPEDARSLLRVGAIGGFIVCGINALTVFVSFTSFYFYGSTATLFYPNFGSVVGIALAAGTFIQLIGPYGLWKNYGSKLGIATVGVGVAAVVLLFLTSRQYYYYVSIWSLAGFALFGTMFILEGASWIGVRAFTGSPDGAGAVGILFIISGALFCTFLLSILGAILAIPAFLVGGIVLFRAPPPRWLPAPWYPYAPYPLPVPPPPPFPGGP